MAIIDTSSLKKKFHYNQGDLYLTEANLLDVKIFRQVSFKSFSECVSKRKLYVSRQYQFSDYHEGVSFGSLIYRISHPHVVGLPLSKKEMIEWQKRDNHFLPYIGLFPISCWSLNGEDRYMRWKTYDHKGIEVFFGTTIKQLVNALSINEYEVFISKVNYGRRDCFQPEFAVLFCKETGYKDEEELRICFIEKKTPENVTSGVFVPLNNLDFINSITVASLYNRSDAVGAVNLLNEIDLLKGKVHLSSIIENYI